MSRRSIRATRTSINSTDGDRALSGPSIDLLLAFHVRPPPRRNSTQSENQRARNPRSVRPRAARALSQQGALPGRGHTRAAGPDRALGADALRDLSARSRCGARGGRGFRGALARGTSRRARRRAGHDQGQHRDQGRAGPARHRRHRVAGRRGRRAARRARARGRRRDSRQDDDAGLRHVVLGSVELPSAHAQSVGFFQEPGRLQRRRRGRAGGRAACSGSSRASGACRSIRPISAASPVR